MLSKEEKEGMIRDAKSSARKQHFRITIERHAQVDSFDEYISFLNSVQKIFSPLPDCNRPTETKFNKL